MRTEIRLILPGLALTFLASFAPWVISGQGSRTLNAVNVSEAYGKYFGYLQTICEDDLGYIWLGTGEGLIRFDGYEFKTYRHDTHDDHSIAHPNSRAITLDREGGLWVGTTFGVNAYDRVNDNFDRVLLSPGERFSKLANNVSAMGFDSFDRLWCRSASGVYYKEPGADTFVVFDMEGTALAGKQVRDFHLTRKGVFIVSALEGLFTIADDASGSLLVKPVSFSPAGVNTVDELPTGDLLIATEDGLYIGSPSVSPMVKVALPDDRDINISMAIAGNKHIWAVTESGEIIRCELNGKLPVVFDAINTGDKKGIIGSPRAVYEDSFGTLWILTARELLRHDDGGPGFTKILVDAENSRPITVERLVTDRDGNNWLLSGGQLLLSRAGSETGPKPFEKGLPPGRVGEWILNTPDGSVWVPVRGTGIFQLARGADRFVWRDVPGLGDATVYKMQTDQNTPDILWLGTSIGLGKYDLETGRASWYQPKDDVPGMPTNRLSIIEEGDDRSIWMYNTYYSSMSHFDMESGKFTTLFPPDNNRSVLEGDVRDIAFTTGDIWFATLFGLTRFHIRDSSFSLYSMSDGLAMNELTAVIPRGDRELWISGNQFISSFNIREEKFYNYDLSSRAGYFTSRARDADRQGNLYFGCTDGVIAFHPDSVDKVRVEPKVLITRLSVNDSLYKTDQPIEVTDIVRLDHNLNDIDIGFIALHRTERSRVTFQCKLEGYDDHWRSLGRERSARYTNLNHGNYTFRVRATTRQGVWDGEEASLAIAISPAFWETGWFRGLIVLVIALITYLLFKVRQHQLTLQKEKAVAEQAAQYKSNFLANVSHEIRTPMNAIMGMSELALDSEKNTEKDEYIETILKSSGDLLQILNELLDHSKLEFGNFEFNHQNFDPEEVLKQVELAFNVIAGRSGLEFILDKKALPTYLVGDPIRLKQILTNLLSNAVKYTREGYVKLSVGHEKLDQGHIQVNFEISDTGVGIPEAQLEHVFDRFETGNMQTDGVSGSTGLGLNITKQLIDRQNGEIYIRSSQGKGTTVYVELPFAIGSTPELSDQKATGSSRALSGVRVLVAEDAEINRMLLQKLLEKRIPSVEITFAENGRQALEQVLESEFDIVLMDVKMPEMSGYQATRAIRQLEDGRKANIPVIGVTASAMQDQLEECFASGMNDVVTKPISSDILLMKMGEVIKQDNGYDRL